MACDDDDDGDGDDMQSQSRKKEIDHVQDDDNNVNRQKCTLNVSKKLLISIGIVDFSRGTIIFLPLNFINNERRREENATLCSINL